MRDLLPGWGERTAAANVGTDKDSEKRQRHAVQGFAKRAGFGIVDEFYDAAVSGADPIETRAGFAALLDRIEGNGVRTVIVEDASRFARELMAQELGITLLISRRVRLLTASGDDLTASDDPTRKMMRQIAGAFAETQRFSNLGIFAVGTRARESDDRDRYARLELGHIYAFSYVSTKSRGLLPPLPTRASPPQPWPRPAEPLLPSSTHLSVSGPGPVWPPEELGIP